MAQSGDALGQTAPRRRVSAALVALAGLLSAFAASACCLAPLALFALGVSGAWIGNLSALAPYQPFFIGATLACLGSGYWLVYRKAGAACGSDAPCVEPRSRRLVLAALWSATVLVLAAAAFPYLAPAVLGV